MANTKKSNVKVVKLNNGDVIIANFVDDNGTAKEPFMLGMVNTPQGPQVQLVPFFPFTKASTFALSVEQFVFPPQDPVDELKAAYDNALAQLIAQRSNLVTPPKGIILPGQ